MSDGHYGETERERRDRLMRENFAAMIRPSVLAQAPRYRCQSSQRRTNLKHFGVRGFYQ